MEALAYTLAKEEKANGIRVNIVAPGLVDTEMGQRLVKATQGVQDIRALDEGMPFGRVCQPEDVSNVVRFLVSDQNSYLTGERRQYQKVLPDREGYPRGVEPRCGWQLSCRHRALEILRGDLPLEGVRLRLRQRRHRECARLHANALAAVTAACPGLRLRRKSSAEPLALVPILGPVRKPIPVDQTQMR